MQGPLVLEPRCIAPAASAIVTALHRDLCIGNWNVTAPNGKEQESV